VARTLPEADGADGSTADAADAAFDVLGRRVRERRRRMGLTLKDLAQRTGLSVPFLSQVENGKRPSLASLFGLARVLDTTPEALLAGPAREDVAFVGADAGSLYPYSDTTRAAVRRQLTGEGEPFSAAEYAAEPGDDLGGFQSSEGREMIYVVAGGLLVEIRTPAGLARHALRPGDTLVYSTSDEHRWSVVGQETTRFLHVLAPGL
jgi:transcriptional regulator with XRE-family HTH domain